MTLQLDTPKSARLSSATCLRTFTAPPPPHTHLSPCTVRCHPLLLSASPAHTTAAQLPAFACRAAVERYEWRVTVSVAAPDCFERPVVMVNGQVQPRLEVTQGNILEVGWEGLAALGGRGAGLLSCRSAGLLSGNGQGA